MKAHIESSNLHVPIVKISINSKYERQMKDISSM